MLVSFGDRLVSALIYEKNDERERERERERIIIDEKGDEK